ncbi:MAG: hypothetical protein ABIG20_00970 [archaeon]
MKSPICGLCASMESLCSSCQGKVDSGEATLADVELARALTQLAHNIPPLDKAEFKRAVSVDNVMLVTVPKGTAGQMIGRGGTFVKEISSRLGKQVKVLEETNDHREIMQKVLFPARCLGVNVVYGARGKDGFKIRVAKTDRVKVDNPESYEKLFSQVLGKETKISFE